MHVVMEEMPHTVSDTFANVHPQSWMTQMRKDIPAAGKGYKNMTWPAHKRWLEDGEAGALRFKGGLPRLPTDEAANRMAQAFRDDTIQLFSCMPHTAIKEQKVQLKKVEGSESYEIIGLPVSGNADFSVVSAPGVDSKLFNAFIQGCCMKGVGTSVVFKADFGEGIGHLGGIWFAVWKMLVKMIVSNGKKLLVLTKPGKNGEIGFAQSIETQWLIEQNLPFVCIDIIDFVKGMETVRAIR